MHQFESGFFVDEPAWHGLGTVLEDAPTIEHAILCSGLDWRVRLDDLTTPDGRKVSHRATVRESDGTILGVVGPAYTPLQNREAFAWFQPLVDEGVVELNAAGSLAEGRRVWILARPAEGARADVTDGDPVERYLLLAHGHDGSLAIRVGWTTVRVVCQNTLSGAIRDENSRLLKIRHLASATDALEVVRDTLRVGEASFRATLAQYRRLAETGCDEVTLRRYVRIVFDGAEAADDEDAAKRVSAKVVPLFTAGRGNRGETLWDAFNAVTEYVTHERGRTQSNRVDSAWFGDGARINRRALEAAVEIAEAA